MLGGSRILLGDVEGLVDSRRAIAIARESSSFSQLVTAEVNLYGNEFCLGHLAAASETLSTLRRDGESYATATEERWVRAAEAHEALIHGRWDAAMSILDHLITKPGGADYLDSACQALVASIELARGDLDGADTGSEKALEGARSAKDPQLLAPALAIRAIVLLAQGRREEASRLATEVLAMGSKLLSALMDLAFAAATPIEFAWLMHDLERDAELLVAVESAPSTPWFQAAKTIAAGESAHAVELVGHIGAPSVEAYTRLRAAAELARATHHAEAHDCLAPALAFFKKVGARRYLAQAELLAASA